MKKIIMFGITIFMFFTLVGCVTESSELDLIQNQLNDIENSIEQLEDSQPEDYANEITWINTQLDEIINTLENLSNQDGSISEDLNTLEGQVFSIQNTIVDIQNQIAQNNLDQEDILANIAVIEDNLLNLDERINNLSNLIDLLISNESQDFALSDDEINTYMSNLSLDIDSISTNLVSGFDLNSNYVNECADETDIYDVCFNSDNYPNIYTEHFFDGLKKVRDLNIVKLLVSESWSNIGGFNSVPKIVGQEMTDGDTIFSLVGRNSTSVVFDLAVSGEVSSFGGGYSMKLAIYKDIDTNVVTVEMYYDIEVSYSILGVNFSSFKFKVDYNALGEIENMLMYKSYVAGLKENITIYTPTDSGLDIHHMIDYPGHFNKEYFQFDIGSLKYVRYSDTEILDPVFEYEEYDNVGLIWAYRNQVGEDDTHIVPLNRFSNWINMGYENQWVSYKIDITLDDDTSIYHEDKEWYNSEDASIIRIDKYDVGLVSLTSNNDYDFQTINDIFVFHGDAGVDFELSSYYKGLELATEVTNSISIMMGSQFESQVYFDTYSYNGKNVFLDENLNLEDFGFELQD